MPTLNWMGKEKVVNHHRDVPYRVLERFSRVVEVPQTRFYSAIELLSGDEDRFGYARAEGEYVKTTDRSVVPGKAYYTESGGSYSKVASPSAGSLSTYYELTGAGAPINYMVVERSAVIKFDKHVASRVFSPDELGRDGYFFRCDFTEDDMYRALDALAAARDRVVSAVSRGVERLHGRDTRNVFYDVTNHCFECDPDDLRRRGVSKERRPNPIVQMGLLQDADGVPITYRLFPGNAADCATMLPVLADMKRDLGLPTVTAVADKGLNCSANMAALVASGDGFVFSQSIRGTRSDRALRSRVLDGRGYIGNDEGTFRVKSWQGTKTVRLKAEDTASGRAEGVGIDVRYVAFWSRRYAERARRERERVIERARELIGNPGAYSRATHFGAARYVRGMDIDKATGEVLDCAHAPALDLEAIERDAEADGYCLIVTSRTGWSDEEVIGAYRGLWRIEESFRVTKSDIEARPVYVRTPAHIEAHFLTCYVALAILRLLQRACPSGPSAAAICAELKRLSCSALEDGWWVFDRRSGLTEELFGAVGVEHPTKYMRTAEIRRLMQKQPRSTTGND